MLITTPGSTTSNSYVTLEEAEQIILESGLSTPLWNSLNIGRGIRTEGITAGPFLPVTGVSDKLSFTVGDGEEQIVTFPELEATITALEACVLINQGVSGLTASPTADNRIRLTVTDTTASLIISPIDHSACSIFGFIEGEYIDVLPTQKEYLLKLSAQLIGYLPLSGMRVFRNQALDFPRQHLPNIRLPLDEVIIDVDDPPEEYLEIPEAVKESQALLSCLVILPNFAKQVEMSEAISIPAALQNAIVSQVQVANVMSVKTSSTTSSAYAEISGVTNRLASLANVFTLPIYLLMKPYLSQIGGGSLQPPEYYDYYLYNEVIAEEVVDPPAPDPEV